MHRDGRLGVTIAALGAAAIVACDRSAERADSLRALEARCGAAAEAVVSPRGVGSIRIGAARAAAAEECPVRSTENTRVDTAFIEQRPIVLHHSAGRIEGITVEDPSFRTDRGIGVGSTIREVRFAYGPLCTRRLGWVSVHVKGLDGIVFETGAMTMQPDSVARELLPAADTDTLRIRRVRIGAFVSGCPSVSG